VELKEIIDQIVLFARTTPDQKLAIVRALQANGEVVGMMGDGVNDAPALAAADIGIVVNNAADVAKQTAELVLLNSRFGTVVAAIQGGRTIFDNIRKTVVYLLADSLVEVTFVVGALLLGLPTPLAAAQIIWLNLVEDILPGVALAFEKNEPGEMTQPPRAKKAPILSSNYRWLILGIVLLTDLLLWLVLRFRPNQTFIFAALGLHSLLAVYSLRVLRRPVWQTSFLANRAVNLAVVLGIGLLLLTIYFPPLQLLLRTQPLHLLDWLWLFLLIQVNLVSIEGVKKLIQIKT
jgi:Ca2+-transporting ATPase